MNTDDAARRSAARGGGARTLRCEEARVLLMGYIDGELESDEARRLEDHLALCVACRREEQAYRKLGEVTTTMVEHGDVSIDINEAWMGIYSRLERRVGWILLSIGLIVSLGYGAWQFLAEFLMADDVPVAIRVGVGTLVAGSLVLLVSFARERLYFRRTERYREVQR